LGEATKIIGGKKLDPKGWNFSFALAFALLFAFSPCRSDHVPYATLATSTGDLLPAFFAFLIPLVVWNWLLLTFRDWAFFLVGLFDTADELSQGRDFLVGRRRRQILP
jgi:hypothetical protein